MHAMHAWHDMNAMHAMHVMQVTVIADETKEVSAVLSGVFSGLLFSALIGALIYWARKNPGSCACTAHIEMDTRVHARMHVPSPCLCTKRRSVRAHMRTYMRTHAMMQPRRRA